MTVPGIEIFCGRLKGGCCEYAEIAAFGLTAPLGDGHDWLFRIHSVYYYRILIEQKPIY